MTLQDRIDEFEKTVVTECLTRLRFSINAAARELGCSRPKIYRLMSKYGISRYSCGKCSDQKWIVDPSSLLAPQMCTCHPLKKREIADGQMEA